MSNRLDKKREEDLQPKRILVAKEDITALGIEITFENDTELEFMFNGEKVKFFPYSGWATGKSINDGRGLRKLLRQLEKGQQNSLSLTRGFGNSHRVK